MDTQNNTSPSPSNDTAENLREWSQKNKAFLDIFLDAFVIVDVTNTVIDFNVAFTELCGESYRKILKTGDFCTLLKTEFCPGECPSRQIFANPRATRLDEVKGASKAFPDLQLIIGGIPIYSDDQKLLGALLTIRNVSAESLLQKKYHERTEESVMDGLTKLYNKVYTESMLKKMVKTALRDPKITLSVLMCDIDHFKKVNDTYGHQAGDHVLATVAQMLKAESRESDVVGRFGGEEFTAILYSSDQAGTKIFGERFRKKLELAQIFFQGKHIPVTASLGTATFSSEWSPGMEVDQVAKDLIARADTALYFAKANGRNQTSQYENLPADKSALAQKAKAAKARE